LKCSSKIWTVARKEFATRVRNRWIWTVCSLLVICVVAIAGFGSAPAGVASVQQSGAALTSLTNLLNYLVPLLALILGSGALIEEKRRGTLDLMLVYPLSSAELFLGTFAGFALALVAAILTGLGLSGMILHFWLDVDLVEYGLVVVSSLALGTSFLAAAFLLSILAREPARALATSILLWIFSVFLFDLILIGTLILSEGDISGSLFRALLLLNPADVFRMMCFQWISGSLPAIGMAAAVAEPPSTLLLSGVMTAWILIPAGLSLWIFQKRVSEDTLI
jgi:Cu-processing system permease protein